MRRTLPAFLVGAVIQGLMAANADSKAPRIERWAAKTSLRAVFNRLPAQKNPVPATDASLVAGIHLYAQNCAVCHGDASAQASALAEFLKNMDHLPPALERTWRQVHATGLKSPDQPPSRQRG